MNNLSWTIYLIQVCDEIRSDAALIGWLVIIAMGAYVAGTAFYGMLEEEWGPNASARRFVKSYAWIVIICMISFAVLPSRRTLLLIVGSEMGERIAKSDGVQSIVDPGMDLIRKWIKQEADKIKDKN